MLKEMFSYTTGNCTVAFTFRML